MFSIFGIDIIISNHLKLLVTEIASKQNFILYIPFLKSRMFREFNKQIVFLLNSLLKSSTYLVFLVVENIIANNIYSVQFVLKLHNTTFNLRLRLERIIISHLSFIDNPFRHNTNSFLYADWI